MFKGQKKEDQLQGGDLFNVDLESGVLSRKSDGSRVAVLDSAGWATLEKELTSTFVTGAAIILQRMGYSLGRYLGILAKKNGVTPDKTEGALVQMARESGWGRLILTSGGLTAGGARISVKGCFFCSSISDSHEPVCHTLAGLISGVLDEVTGHTHRVAEEKCAAKGDAVCELTVERLG